jgi:nitrogen fixation protein FixH
MTARWKWLLAIASLLAANVIAMVTLAVVANRGGAQVIPDYYAKATRYDDELSRSAASRALGWHVEIAMAGRTVDAVVSDASGAPIDRAAVRITGYQRAHAVDTVDVVLTASSGGHYRGAIPGRLGWYDLVASIDTAAAHFSQRVVIEAR